tara:strand:- start:3505 stop:4107 length:603 start_codon:yes stop_codon:yes gene_type:complete
MNKFNRLTVEESNDTTIESKNELRKCCKKLRQKSIKFARVGGEDLRKEIEKLIIEIEEYKNLSAQPKKKEKKKEIKGLLDDDDYFMNKIIKEKKMYQIKQAIRQNRINKLWREPLSEYSKLEYPQWSPKTHTLFPLHMKNIIIQLSCYFNQEDTIFSILPQEVFFRILENLTWVDFPDKITSNNVVTVYQRNGEKNVIKW